MNKNTYIIIVMRMGIGSLNGCSSTVPYDIKATLGKEFSLPVEIGVVISRLAPTVISKM